MLAPAVVFCGVDDVRVQDIDMPPPERECVQIRTSYSSISVGTETWALRDQFTWAKTKFPGVPGYQRVGVITELGEGVSDWRVGDKVMATTGQWSGPVGPCPVPWWGSHAAVANTHLRELYRIPAGVSDIDASATVVAQVGYNAAYRAQFEPGDWVVVYGDGIIGQFAAQAARSRGARVALVGHRKERLSLAAEFSADAVINNRDQNVAEAFKKLSGKSTARVVLDSVQHVDAQKEYVALLEHGKGQVVYCGFTPGTVWADMALLQQRELTTHFISGWSRPRMDATLALMAQKKLRMEPLVTHRVPPARAAELYRMALQKSAPFLGLTIQWS